MNHESNRDEKREIVQDLVAGCPQKEASAIVPHYFIERVFGQCRPFVQAQLSGVDFSELNLSGATFIGTDLSDTNFYNATLTGTDMSQSNLRGADISFATFKDANLREVNLSNATIHHGIYENINFSHANFSGVRLIRADFSSKSDLSNANFSNAYVYSSTFLGARLDEANLSNATFSETHFGDASLSNADFSNTLFLSTLLRTAQGLTQAQLESANPPLICNSPLPKAMNNQVSEHRDCDNLTQILQQKHPEEFENREAVETYFKAVICDSFVSRNVEMEGYDPTSCSE